MVKPLAAGPVEYLGEKEMAVVSLGTAMAIVGGTLKVKHFGTGLTSAG